MSSTDHPKTIFCDIDGTLTYQPEHFIFLELLRGAIPLVTLPEAKEKINACYDAGDTIILTTARSEFMRLLTVAELKRLGIKYHQLIMDLPDGPRVLINNRDSRGTTRAFAYDLEMNEGFGKVEI